MPGVGAIILVFTHLSTHDPSPDASPGPSAAREHGVCFPQPRRPAGHCCAHFRAQPVCEGGTVAALFYV